MWRWLMIILSLYLMLTSEDWISDTSRWNRSSSECGTFREYWNKFCNTKNVDDAKAQGCNPAVKYTSHKILFSPHKILTDCSHFIVMNTRWSTLNTETCWNASIYLEVHYPNDDHQNLHPSPQILLQMVTMEPVDHP